MFAKVVCTIEMKFLKLKLKIDENEMPINLLNNKKKTIFNMYQ